MKLGYWKTWREIRKASSKKEGIFLYGRSEDWVHKAISSLPETNLLGIVDRNRDHHGSTYLDLKIGQFEEIENPKNYFFLITAGEFDGILDVLSKSGLTAGIDYACSPDFRDLRFIKEFTNIHVSAVIACSDYNDFTRARSSRMGGGLYKFDSSTKKIEKKAKGSYRQLQLVEGSVYAVEYVEGAIDQFDRDLNFVERYYLPGTNLCGIAYNEHRDCFYVSNAATDAILEVRLDTNDTAVLKHFMKKGMKREAHINDLCFHDGKLFVSYFSKSGNYKYGVFDGGVSVIDIDLNLEPQEIINGLWKPHSPSIFDGQFYVLDSMRGNLLSGKPNSQLQFPGFVRGLDKKKNIWAIGQSQDMYISEHIGSGRTISIDPGVYLCDNESHIQRFYPLPSIMNIHDIKITDVYTT
ncbi:DUF4915 domain-containing protein [Rhodobacteraceae bacterium nBUS_24]